MATKYKVSQNGVVFGNYPGANAEEAILKAYNKNKQYHNFDFSQSFDIKHGSKEYTTFVEVNNER